MLSIRAAHHPRCLAGALHPAIVWPLAAKAANVARTLLGLRSKDVDAARVPVDANFVLGLLVRKLEHGAGRRAIRFKAHDREPS